MDARADMDDLEKWKINFHYRGSNPSSSVVQSVARTLSDSCIRTSTHTHTHTHTDAGNSSQK